MQDSCKCIESKTLESFATAKLYGLYLVDKNNMLRIRFVDHIAPDCHSYQLYKGIADDEATANFNGHIVASECNAPKLSK